MNSAGHDKIGLVPPADAPARRRLPSLLRRAWYGLNQAFRRRIAHLGITPDQFTVLRVLQENQSLGIMQRELAQLMSSDPNTVASLLERMEKAGFVQRKPHETDRRAYRLLVEPAGRDKYLEAKEIAVQLQTEVLACLPPDQHDIFLEQLARVAECCRQAADSGDTDQKDPV